MFPLPVRGGSLDAPFMLHPARQQRSLNFDLSRHPRSRMKPRANQGAGLTLTELLCVIAIIAILLALYLPAIARAFMRVKKFLFDE